MSIDLDRITHPLRLAKGSHQPGSGKGCAMNVISYISGDVEITDFPECSARPLARMVQRVNDELAGPDGYLSPENSVLVLDLGWQTVGTAGVPRSVVLRWLAELLIDPVYGVEQHARPAVVPVIRRMAALLTRQAAGKPVSTGEWKRARDAAAAVAAAYAVAYADAADTAVYAAVYAAADADAGVADAIYADAFGAYDTYSSKSPDARIAFTRWAIRRWRALAGLDDTPDPDPTDIDHALERIGGPCDE